MKRAILLLIVVVGGAFYLGWFTFTTDNSGQTEHVNIVIDKTKVHAAEAQALEKLHSFEQQAESQAQSNQDQSNQAAVPGSDRSASLPPAAPVPSPASAGAGPLGGYASDPSAGNDPYADESAVVPARPAAETAENFSQGFQ